MNYKIKEILTFNNQDYSEDDFVEVTYKENYGTGTETKLRGRIDEFSTNDSYVVPRPYMVIDFSKEYRCDKETIYFNNIIKIEKLGVIK